ncbi:PREDICTED: coiled-coil domain-containing protein 125 [Dipodomys ordii]|uniref:Coiled-coil domain-containing protein 125 n=1 Tax=Dipodomys ordii TaxID=10020 RepID=A0A1S3F5E8_DIPOR|nr:PREDICTED: coiled-coil domain-containing protein 125 [Dipodomys ordii]
MSKEVRPSSESEVQIWGTEEDDMTEGDLGYGLGRRPSGIYKVEGSHLSMSKKRSVGKHCSPPPFSSKGEETGGALFQYCKHGSLQDGCPPGYGTSSFRRQSSSDSNSELSNEELRQRLHETLEEVEILKTELEASQRQLEGKEEALKILQSMAVLGKATSHTQAALQKTMEQKRSLEKVLALNCDNAILKEDLKLKTEEIKMLKSENAVLNQHYLEALAMLDIKEQKVSQESLCQDKSGFTEVSGLELAVLGACLCGGPGGSPCSCAKMAASTRKLVLQLKHELELLQKSKEEAYIMADAFRIAFEEQLMRKNDQALRWTQMDKMCKKSTKGINWKRVREDGGLPQRGKKTLGQKLLGMLPSENSCKRVEDLDNSQDVFKMLIDLLNDKEEALAHQRKVSYMLARALEEKDIATKENKEKTLIKENFVFKNLWHKTSEFSVVRDSVHSDSSFNSAGCICSIQQPQTALNHSRTLKRSSSLPSSLLF